MTIAPTDWKQRQADTLNQVFTNIANVRESSNFETNPDPEYDYLKKAETAAFNADAMRRNLLNQLMTNSNIKAQNQVVRQAEGGGQIQGGGNLAQLMAAIRTQESGGNYQARNADSGAAGAYQIMPANIVGSGGWDTEALGRDVNLKAFLNHPHMQNKIARYKLGNYLKNYGAAGAASAWYSGDPSLWNNTDSQGNYPTIHQYVLDILKMMGRG